jgi:hypothetical protein
VWHRLPPAIRAAVLTLVNTAAPPADAPMPADPLDDSLPPGFEQRSEGEQG